MAGSKSSKKVEPWQTAEWRAHCAAERQRFRDGLFYQLMAPVMGPVIVDLNGSDEEMWRRANDPARPTASVSGGSPPVISQKKKQQNTKRNKLAVAYEKSSLLLIPLDA